MRTKKKILEALKSTQLPSIHLSVMEERPTTCIDSKFGGVYYLPKESQIPTCPEGEPMQFLAQINFSQMSTLEGFPKTGLLQFFIDTDEERFEEKIDDPDLTHELCVVRYYPSPDASLQQELPESCTLPNESFGFVDGSWFQGKMSFHSTTEVATMYLGMDGLVSSLGYEAICNEQITPELIKQSRYDIENSETAVDELCWNFGNWGTKIGGHPAVHQADPRMDIENGENYTALLFQYDFCTKQEMEASTFQFFIQPKDLAAGKFDDILFCFHNCFG